ncbi:MAG: pentapeptide repeat-containing protein [Verrucomicrobiaceae bacterium]|nr:pentapeptide repeat-containing protein [Verrucomicrobiaceae bacterium]
MFINMAKRKKPKPDQLPHQAISAQPLQLDRAPTSIEWEIAGKVSSDTVLSFADFKAIVMKGNPTRFERCIFTEVMNVESLVFHQALIFLNCTFQRVLNASKTRFLQAPVFRDCIFEQSLTLEYAKVMGTLDLRGSTVKLPEGGENYEYVDPDPYLPPPRFRSAKWASIFVDGNLELDRLVVWGSLDLGHAEIRGAVNMRGVEIGKGDKFKGRFYMRQATVDGDLELEPSVEILDPKKTDVRQTKVYGSISIGASVFHGRVNVRGIDIDGCLHAITVHIRGRVLGDCWRQNADVRQTVIGRHHSDQGASPSILFHDATVDEAVWFHGVLTTGSVEFENARIGGSLELDAWLRLEAQPALKTHRTHLGVNSDRDSLSIKNAEIAANVRLDGALLEGRIVGHNCRIGAAILCRPKKYKLSECKESKVYRPKIKTNGQRKSISLYGAQVESDIDISGSHLVGGLRMRYTKIRGAVLARCWPPSSERECDTIPLRQIRTRIGLTEDGQSLYLYGAEVGGNVCIERATLMGQLSLELGAVKGSIILKGSRIGEQLTTNTGAVKLAKARIDNDVSLEGLKAHGALNCASARILGDLSMGDKEPASVSGDIDVSGAEISGTCDLMKCMVHFPIETSEACLSFTDAKVNKLAVDVSTWDKVSDPREPRVTIRLGGFQFREIAVKCTKVEHSKYRSLNVVRPMLWVRCGFFAVISVGILYWLWHDGHRYGFIREVGAENGE